MKKRSFFSLVVAFAMMLSIVAPAFSVDAVAQTSDTAVTEDRVYHRYAEVKYEAENAQVTGADIATNHTDYSGTGFVANFDAVGDKVVFPINIPALGDYSFYFRYSNGSGHKAHANVYLDGVLQETIPFHMTSSWDEWSDSEIGVTNLTSGSHALEIAFADYAINIDYMNQEERHESIRSFYLSNWSNLMAIWKDTKLCSEDTPEKGPSIRELRYAANWSQNQITDYSGFFRDETGANVYTNSTSFDGEAYFASSGGLYSNYLKYDGAYPEALNFSRDYFMLPNKNVLLTRYIIENEGNTAREVSVLDMLHPNNESNAAISAQYRADLNAIVVNMSSAGQYYLALGAFDTGLQYQVANDQQTSESVVTCSPWITFNNNGILKNNNYDCRLIGKQAAVVG